MKLFDTIKILWGSIKSLYYLLSSYKIRKIRKGEVDDLIYTTKEGIQIIVYPGKKPESKYDFYRKI